MFSTVLILTIIMQLLSVLRTSELASHFGTTSQMDAMNLANLMMVCIINIGGASISVVIIPFLASMKTVREGKKVLNTYVITILGISYVLLILSFVAGFVLVEIFSLKEMNSFYYMLYLMMFIMGVGQFFRMISWIQTAYLQMDSRFVTIKLGGLIAALASYIYILLKQNLTIYEAAIAIMISFFIECVFLFLANRNHDYKLDFNYDFKSKEYRQLMKLTVPVMLNAMVYQFIILIPNFAGGYFGEGYISMMTYANQIANIFQTLIVLNVLAMLYPTLSRAFTKSVNEGIQKLGKFINLSNMIVIPVVIGAIILGPNIIKLLFQRGSFTAESTLLVWYFVIFLVLSLPFIVIRELIFKTFYSLGDTKTPVTNSIIGMVFQIVFLLVGIFKLGIVTLVISPLIISSLSTVLAWISLKRKIDLQEMNKPIFKQHCIYIMNSFVMGCVVYFCLGWMSFGVLLDTVLCIFIGIVCYGLLTLVTHQVYIKQMKNILRIRR